MTTKRFEARRWLRDNWLELGLLLALAVAIVWLAAAGREIWQTFQPEPIPTPAPVPAGSPATFDGQRAAGIVSFLAALGPRTPGSEALLVTAERIEQELADSGWQVEVQSFDLDGVTRRNIVARAGEGQPAALLGTHYDSSPLADRDPTEANRASPAPGANDGASGVAVLLELARTLDQKNLPGQVELVFFDAQYGSDGVPAAAGVQEFIRAGQAAPSGLPQTAVLVDLLGGVAQQFTIDAASDPALSQRVWRLAEQLGYSGWFVPEAQAGLALGQTALAGAGVPAAVIAASMDPTYRTLQDTPDRIDPQGLARVGQVLRMFVEGGAR